DRRRARAAGRPDRRSGRRPARRPPASGRRPAPHRLKGRRVLYELIAVTKRYGASVTAVDAVDLVIDKGEFVVIAGPSGPGKTTMLQLLGGLDRPTSGRVDFEGRPLAELGDGELADLRRDRIGFVFQQFNLI